MGNTSCCNRLDVLSLIADKKNNVEISNLLMIENNEQTQNENLFFEKAEEKIIVLQNNWRCYKARTNVSKAKSEKYFNLAKIPGLELSQNQMINRCTPLMEEVEKKLGSFDQSKKKVFNPFANFAASSKNVNPNTNFNCNDNNNNVNFISISNSNINVTSNNNIGNLQAKDSYKSMQNINESNMNSSNNIINNNNNNSICLEKEDPEKKDSFKTPLRITSILYQDNTIYSGSFNYKWEKHGFGTLYTKENAKISGFFCENKLCGRGRIIYPEGDYFEGEFSEDKLSGFGEYVNLEGIKYRGEWKDDMKNGFGEESHLDGTFFAGEFFNDLKHGKGRFQWPDGSVYEGSLDKNQIEGVGKITFFDGQFFKGEWRMNKIEGKGVFVWPDKKVYIGCYKNEKKWGYGVFIWPNGKRYEGQWLNGKQHGFGICYWNQKKQLSEWRLGKKQKMQSDSVEEMKNKIMQINLNVSEIIAFCKTLGLEIDENFNFIKIEGIHILYELSATPTNNERFLMENIDFKLQQE